VRPGIGCPLACTIRLHLGAPEKAVRTGKWVSFMQTGGHYRLYVCSHLRKSVIDFPYSRLYFFVDRVNGSTAGIVPGAWFP
jgi:hypothetical protein